MSDAKKPDGISQLFLNNPESVRQVQGIWAVHITQLRKKGTKDGQNPI